MTTILDAVQAASVADAAHAYIEAGCSIIPLHGKKPAPNFRWQHWIHNQPTPALINAWLKRGLMQGIGLVAGAVSGNLVLLDVDSLEACDEFEAKFGENAHTLTIRSGSGRGKHYYFYVGRLPQNTYQGGVELRASGAYVVAPPSLHPSSGEPYTVIRAVAPRRFIDMERLREWILSRGKPAPSRSAAPYTGAANASAYARAALSGECRAVAFAPKGSRNRTLFNAALKLGPYIASGELERGDVESGLLYAATALSQEDGEAQCKKTITNGIEFGINNPARPRRGA